MPLIALSRSQLMLNHGLLGNIEDGTVDDDALEELRRRLAAKRQLHIQLHRHKPLPDEVLLEVEQDLPFDLVQRIAEACAQAGYTRLAFMGVQLPK